MSKHPDPVREGLARGWRVHGGPHAPLPERIECDVAIVGSGAGAGSVIRATKATVWVANPTAVIPRDTFDRVSARRSR